VALMISCKPKRQTMFSVKLKKKEKGQMNSSVLKTSDPVV